MLSYNIFRIETSRITLLVKANCIQPLYKILYGFLLYTDTSTSHPSILPLTYTKRNPQSQSPSSNQYTKPSHLNTFRDCQKWALSLTRQVDHKVKGVGRKALQAPRGDDEFVLEGSEYYS